MPWAKQAWQIRQMQWVYKGIKVRHSGSSIAKQDSFKIINDERYVIGIAKGKGRQKCVKKTVKKKEKRIKSRQRQ